MTFPEWKEEQQARAVAMVAGLVALGILAIPLAVVAARRLREWLARRDAAAQAPEGNHVSDDR